MSTEERSAAARYLGARGARATNAKLTPEQRATNARKAGKASAAKRWGTLAAPLEIGQGPMPVSGAIGRKHSSAPNSCGVQPKPKPKPKPKPGTNGARVLGVIQDLAIFGPGTTVQIAREAGLDRATTRAALAHLAAAGHVESEPKPGSRREKLWRLA